MLKFTSKLLTQLAVALALLLAPITTMAGGVVTEGMTGEDSLTLVNSAFGVYTGDQAIAIASDDSDEEETEAEEEADEDDDSDDTDDAVYLWMSSVFGGHDAAMDGEGAVPGDFDGDVSNSDSTDPQLNAAGGCAATPTSALSLLIGLAAFIRRRRR